MHAGDPSGVTAGSNDDLILDLERIETPDGLGEIVRVLLAFGEGDTYWALVCDGQVQEVRWISNDNVSAGIPEVFLAFYDPGLTYHAVSLEPLGDWPNTDDLTPEDDQQAWLADKAKSVQIDWDCVVEEVEAYGDFGSLSGWSLAGLQRWVNCSPYLGRSTQGKLDLEVVSAGADHTVNLYSAGVLVCSGSRTGDGVVSLSEQNGSGLSGSVTLAYNYDMNPPNAWIVARWAASYKVHISTSLSFPRSPEAMVLDNGLANVLSARIDDLPAGTYAFVVQAVSDTGTSGSNTAAMGTVVVPGRPEPPGEIAYDSGDYLATVVSFQASATGGATYRVYDSLIGEPINFEVPAGTRGAGSGTLTLTLPALPAPESGLRRISIAAVNGGIEDGYRRSLKIEYDGGVYVPPRPNAPTFKLSAISGLALTAAYRQATSGEQVAAATVKLYLVAEGDDPSMASPAASAAVGAAVNGVRTGTIQASAGGEGWYLVMVRTAAADGTLSSNGDTIGPFWLSAAVPDAPARAGAVVVG